MHPKTKQKCTTFGIWGGVTLNDFGLTLAPLCGHLLTCVGPSWAYKKHIYTFTSVLKPGGGGEMQGGSREAPRRLQVGSK